MILSEEQNLQKELWDGESEVLASGLALPPLEGYAWTSGFHSLGLSLPICKMDSVHLKISEARILLRS